MMSSQTLDTSPGESESGQCGILAKNASQWGKGYAMSHSRSTRVINYSGYYTYDYSLLTPQTALALC